MAIGVVNRRRIYLRIAVILWNGVSAASLSTAMPSEPAAIGREQNLKQQLSGKRFDGSRVSLRVEKSKFLLTVVYRGRAVRSYPVVLGTDPVGNKRFEGDGRTPEGDFKIVDIRSPHKWSKFLLLSYPTAASRRRFAAARSAGRIPVGATVGGYIGIHGVPKGHDGAIDSHQNWTAGCVSLKTHDIDEIASVCRRGTLVRILH